MWPDKLEAPAFSSIAGQNIGSEWERDSNMLLMLYITPSQAAACDRTVSHCEQKLFDVAKGNLVVIFMQYIHDLKAHIWK